MNPWNHPRWGEESKGQQQLHLMHQLHSLHPLHPVSQAQTMQLIQPQQGQANALKLGNRSQPQPLMVPLHTYPYYPISEFPNQQPPPPTHTYHDDSVDPIPTFIGQQTQPPPVASYVTSHQPVLDQDHRDQWAQQQQQQQQILGSGVRHQQLSTFIYPPGDIKMDHNEMIPQYGGRNYSVSSSTSSTSSQKTSKSGSKSGGSGGKAITKRSRMGCLTCRQRKKRCCETKPRCTECCRLGLNCVWPKPGTEHKNKPKDTKNEENTIDHDVYGKIKVLRGIVEYKS